MVLGVPARRAGPELWVLVCHGKECVLCPKNSAKSRGIACRVMAQSARHFRKLTLP